MKGLFEEFRKFALRGSVVDLAVGVVIGGAFGKIVSSFVANIIMPPLNLITARFGVNFQDLALKINTESPKLDDAGQVVKDDAGNAVMVVQDYPILNIGPFIQTVVDFILIAAAIFIAIKAMNKAKERFEKKEEEKPAEPSEEILLLREIRDSLNKS